MTKPIDRDPIYRRRRFDREIIDLCVRWYLTYRLSYRDLVAMMAERGVRVSHTTILRWVVCYVPESSRNGGIDEPARFIPLGVSTRPTFTFKVGGTTSSEQSTSLARQWTSYCAQIAVWPMPRRSSERRCPAGGRSGSHWMVTRLAMKPFGCCVGRIISGDASTSEAVAT